MKNSVYHIKSISELHKIANFEKPRHPLVTIVDYSKVEIADTPEYGSFICDFYSVSFKKYCSFIYGKQAFDHQEGTLHCSDPGQLITFDRKKEAGGSEGWGLYFHPELIRNTGLGNKIHEYTFFSYDANEALQLSGQEKETLTTILKQMKQEYNTNIDRYSNEIIVSNIELLLNYCKRYYGRQFITRTNQNKDILVRFEKYINEFYYSSAYKSQGILTVKHCAEIMNLSTNYFSDLLKIETGKNAQEHIHYHMLEQAKKLLSGSGKRIDEIAFELGFQFPQGFSKLFKQKEGITPSQFRNNIINN